MSRKPQKRQSNQPPKPGRKVDADAGLTDYQRRLVQRHKICRTDEDGPPPLAVGTGDGVEPPPIAF